MQKFKRVITNLFLAFTLMTYEILSYNALR